MAAGPLVTGDAQETDTVKATESEDNTTTGPFFMGHGVCHTSGFHTNMILLDEQLGFYKLF